MTTGSLMTARNVVPLRQAAAILVHPATKTVTRLSRMIGKFDHLVRQVQDAVLVNGRGVAQRFQNSVTKRAGKVAHLGAGIFRERQGMRLYFFGLVKV